MIFLKNDDTERIIVSHTNIGTVSKATLGKLLRDELERIYRLFRPHRYTLNSTELYIAVRDENLTMFRFFSRGLVN